MMSDLRKAAQQALEALEANLGNWAAKTKATTALREALAQPEQQSVAHVYFLDEPSGRPRVAWDNANGIKIGDKLYTAPPQRKLLQFAGLSITEIRLPVGMTSRFENGVLIIEADNGIKGEA